MSRRDPGAANGGVIVEPGRCSCSHLEPMHRLNGSGRKGCAAYGCGCVHYDELRAGRVIQFPGAGIAPAPAGPPRLTADLDAIGDRYTDLLDARHRGATAEVRLLEAACADDVPALREEIHRLELLRRELATELDRVTGRG